MLLLEHPERINKVASTDPNPEQVLMAQESPMSEGAEETIASDVEEFGSIAEIDWLGEHDAPPPHLTLVVDDD